MNTLRQHRSILGLVASIPAGLFRPVASLLHRRASPDRYEQRNVDGYITRVRTSTEKNGPTKKDTRAAASRGAGTEVNRAAAAYMAALRLEPSHMESETSVSCV